MIREMLIAGSACFLALGLSACGESEAPAPGVAPATATEVLVGVSQADALSPMGVYRATFTATSDTHTVALIHLDGDASWAIYGAPDFESHHIRGCDEDATGSGDEICTAETLVAGQPYYLRIDAWDDEAGRFTILVD